MKKIILAISILVLCSTSFGVEHIKKGDESPYDGYVFTVKEERTLRANNERRLKLEDLRAVDEDIMKLQEKRILNYKKYVDEMKPINGWQKAGYFALGFLATSASLYVSSRILND